MNFPISDKMTSLKPSIIREIFKYASDPGVITLAAGSPAPEALPAEALARMMNAVLVENPGAALQYSVSEGHPPFVAKLRALLAEQYGVIRESDRILITSGAQQAMDLVTKVLVNEGDVIVTEEPSFIGSLNTFRSYNAKLVGVPIEEDGICVEKLEEALASNKNIRFLYVIPNFQNPTGITMSMAKRRAVYDLARKYDIAILEDNPYGDLRFTGEALPAIKTLDEDGRVFYAGTFSKILSPGVRVGYLVAPEGPFGKLAVAKQCTDVHTSMPAQLLCQRFLEETELPAHLAASSGIYAAKCGLMLRELERTMPESVSWTKPEGGLFIWVTLPGHIDGAEFATRLVQEKKVCVVPGTAFATVADSPTNTIRLNFSAPTNENIVKAIGMIASLLGDMNA